ncbi:MAG: hypothetical protein JW863_19915 [Chitinispirillaceae bacterium]|nr:hypothetical protein [Chitinispirillaceae bacterium]
MRALHIGFACSSERNADRFFRDLLGLTKQDLKTIPVSIVKPLFGLDTSLPAINYTGADLHAEVFISDISTVSSDRISHTCLEVGNAEELIERAAASGFSVTRIPKGNGQILFLDDLDGNRFEIKQVATGL